MTSLNVFIFVVWLSVTLASVDPRPRIQLTRKGVYPTTLAPSGDNNDDAGQLSTESIPSKPKVYARPESLEGWLSEPKPPSSRIQVRSPAGAKTGYCDHLQNYGIKCGIKFNQCKEDKDCPGVTKCCSVSDCGFLCVKPTEKLKPAKILKKKGKEQPMESDEETVEAVTTAEGLKINDITVITPP